MVAPPKPDPWLASRYAGRFNAHLHAMGAVLVGYNLLEQIFRSKLAGYLGCEDEITGYIYDVMAENSIREIANMAVKASNLPDAVKEREYTFTLHFGRCAQNRNSVAHSFLKRAEDGDAKEYAVLEKWVRKKFNKENLFSASLSELRQVADDMTTTFKFGRDMSYYVWLNHKDCFHNLAVATEKAFPAYDGMPTALPDKPPEPFLLPLLASPAP